MESCTHVEHLEVSTDVSILDPSRWQCSVCGTTEWVWACLSCGNMACGRMNEQHAEKHFQNTQHPLAIEINEKYVYCYVCDEYVIGDNVQGVIQSLRSALTDIGTLSFEEVQHKGGKLLRSYSFNQEFSRSQADEDDRLVTATCHYRKSLLAKVFSAWQVFTQKEKELKAATGNDTMAHPAMITRSRSSLFHVKKRTLIPGVTGLRNLGNTCYINSIIQALGHLEDFREYFCQLVFGLFSPTGTPLPCSSPASISPQAAKQLLRLETIEYFQHLSGHKYVQPSQNKATASQNKGGLHGGGSTECSNDQELSVQVAVVDPLAKTKSDLLKTLSLCQELHGLLRVLWSGKWAQVSPHGFLHAVWKAIPMFKGHSQHDAQEFLCELLDKVSQEIENLPQCKGAENIVDQSFRGEIVSQVTCSTCSNISSRNEPFLDLSLEFPRSFQYTSSQVKANMCHITEMLSTFTDVEQLEPQSYLCEKCNKTCRRSRTRRQKEVRTDARKQLLISKPPEILRLHLKRFRWCGRNNREKIGTHVAFDEELDISPFCQAVPAVSRYRLHSVVVHHGAGFRAGHYTTYTYNNCAASWLHCNDSRVQLVPLEEVLSSQAYILFYTRELTPVSLDDMPGLTSLGGQPDTLSTVSTIPDFDLDTLQTIKRLSQGEIEQAVDDEVSFSFRRNPTLVKKISTLSSHTGGLRFDSHAEQELSVEARQGLHSHAGQGLNSNAGKGLDSYARSELDSYTEQDPSLSARQGLSSNTGKGLDSHSDKELSSNAGQRLASNIGQGHGSHTGQDHILYTEQGFDSHSELGLSSTAGQGLSCHITQTIDSSSKQGLDSCAGQGPISDSSMEQELNSHTEQGHISPTGEGFIPQAGQEIIPQPQHEIIPQQEFIPHSGQGLKRAASDLTYEQISPIKSMKTVNQP